MKAFLKSLKCFSIIFSIFKLLSIIIIIILFYWKLWLVRLVWQKIKLPSPCDFKKSKLIYMRINSWLLHDGVCIKWFFPVICFSHDWYKMMLSFIKLTLFNLSVVLHTETGHLLCRAKVGWPIKCQCCPYIENSQLICTANQLVLIWVQHLYLMGYGWYSLSQKYKTTLTR